MLFSLMETIILVWHDYAYNPEKVRFEIMNAIMDGMPKEFHGNLYHVANSMCAIYIKGNFKTKEFEINSNPNMTFEVDLKMKNI